MESESIVLILQYCKTENIPSSNKEDVDCFKIRERGKTATEYSEMRC